MKLNTAQNRLKNAIYSNPNFSVALVYFFVLLLCFDQLVLGEAVVKWDAYRLWYPWKHFVVNEILNGDLPLWNPYHLAGFPQHGDSMTWYPISWLFGFITGGYNLTSLNLEYLFHLFIAGFGFYKLMKLLNKQTIICVLLGLSYMLSGFMLGNAQHMGWIVSAAWLPWLALYLYRLIQQPGWTSALTFSLIAYLFFSGGYLAIFFITLYLLVGFVLYSVYKKWKSDSKKTIIFLVVSFVMIALLSAPILHSIIELSSLFDRASPEALGSNFNINYGGTPANGIIAMFLPLVSGIFNVPEIEFGTFSTYFGSIPIVLILFKLRSLLSDKRAFLLFVLGVFFLLVSVGSPLPFRNLLGHLPLLDLFRYPTIFRLFAIFIFLALVAILYREDNFASIRAKVANHPRVIIVFSFLSLLLAVLVFLFSMDTEIAISYFSGNPVDYLASLSANVRGILNVIIALVMLTIVLVLLKFFEKYNRLIIAVFWGLELILVAHLSSYSVVNQPVNVGFANERLDQQPKMFHQIAEDYVENEKNNWKNYVKSAWEGRSILVKQPSANGFSPMKLKVGVAAQTSKISIPDSSGFLSRIRLINDHIELLPTHARIIAQGTSDWRMTLDRPLGENEYLVVKQRFTPQWLISSESTSQILNGVTNSGYMWLKPSGNQNTILLSYDDQLYWLSVGLFTVALLIILVLLFMKSRDHKTKWIILISVLFILTLGLVQNGYRWFPTYLPKITETKITSGNDMRALESYLIGKDRESLYILRDTPKSNRFLDELSYYLDQEDLVTTGGLTYQLYEPSMIQKKRFVRLTGQEFATNGFKLDMSDLVRNTLNDEVVYVRIDFKNPNHHEVQLWLNHSSNGEWISGTSWELQDAIRWSDGTQTFIRSIDLNHYQIQKDETLTLFVYSDDKLTAFNIEQLLIEEAH